MLKRKALERDKACLKHNLQVCERTTIEETLSKNCIKSLKVLKN